jgi:hypothetical protein
MNLFDRQWVKGTARTIGIGYAVGIALFIIVMAILQLT